MTVPERKARDLELRSERPTLSPQRQRGAAMISSKLTSKAQTTVPRAVRAALQLGVGDTIVYAIEDDHVIMTKAVAPSPEIITASYEEWDSENDRHAYASL
jgi:antitoxin PrlF